MEEIVNKLTHLGSLLSLMMLNIIPCQSAKADTFGEQIIDAFKNGHTQLEFRARHEECRQNNLEHARATTIRSDLSFTTTEFRKLKISLGLVDVTNVFGNKYNSNLSNLKNQQYSKIYDPAGTGLTQANLIINAIPETNITIGRQYIILDNERFVGKDDFRQFPQSFDAFTINTKALQDFEIFYSFVLYVNTTSANALALDVLPRNTTIPVQTNVYFESGRHRLRTHLANVNWSGFAYGNIGIYTYFNNDRINANNSNVTYGFRVHSTEQKNYRNINYLIEIAKQNNKFNNPNPNSTYYWHLLLGKTFEYASAAIGWEHLGKNMNTALGSLHDFNGIGDVFHSQPFAHGLNDFYLSLNAGNHMFSGEIGAHLFEKSSTSLNRSIGFEYDITGEFHFNKNFTISASYAYFKSKGKDYPSANKYWLTFNAKLI